VSDFDRDGRLDLAITQFSAAGAAGNGVAILLGDGNGGFGAPARFEVGRGATRIVAADFNADGDTDVAVLNSNSGTVSILLGDGHGSLGPQTTLPVGGTPIGLALGDFNGDGKADLVVTELFTAQVNVMLGRGDGSFSEPASFPVGQQPLWWPQATSTPTAGSISPSATPSTARFPSCSGWGTARSPLK
jgi:hypothetical protein